jgi:peptidoglycan/xylan/chitin deacetylase (PgdA/CDA1 family)
MWSRISALIPNKREFLARRLHDAGVLRLLERASRRPSLLVVTYHRIGRTSDCPYYDAVVSASPGTFREQVRYLRDHFRLMTLAELIAPAGDGLRVAEPSALITFDDGYRDNFDEALPILQSLGAPATFFIPTGFFESPRLPWWDHAAWVVKRTGRGRISLDRPDPMTLDLEGGPDARRAALMMVIGLYLAGRIDDEAGFRRHLEERAEVEVDEDALGRALFMTWDQVRHLAASGMAIGSHTHDHRRLATLSEEEQRREMAESRRILERELGRPVEALAYPFGWAGTFDGTSERLAREAGYRLAFSSIEGVNRPGATDPFALRRLGIGYADSPALVRARAVLHASCGASFL